MRHIIHQSKYLRDFLELHGVRFIETFHYPRYVIQVQKKRQMQAKIKKKLNKVARKRCPRQLNIQLLTEKIENIGLRFL